MSTTIREFVNAPTTWQLAATGPVTVILSSTNGPGLFIHTTASTPPLTQEGHPIKEGENVTFNVKTGEFLHVKADRPDTKIIVTD